MYTVICVYIQFQIDFKDQYNHDNSYTCHTYNIEIKIFCVQIVL